MAIGLSQNGAHAYEYAGYVNMINNNNDIHGLMYMV